MTLSKTQDRREVEGELEEAPQEEEWRCAEGNRGLLCEEGTDPASRQSPQSVCVYLHPQGKRCYYLAI